MTQHAQPAILKTLRSASRKITGARSRKLAGSDESQTILHHWREAVPDDRFAHLVKDATRSFFNRLRVHAPSPWG